jgi:hypothetical protein
MKFLDLISIKEIPQNEKKEKISQEMNKENETIRITDFVSAFSAN